MIQEGSAEVNSLKPLCSLCWICFSCKIFSVHCNSSQTSDVYVFSPFELLAVDTILLRITWNSYTPFYTPVILSPQTVLRMTYSFYFSFHLPSFLAFELLPTSPKSLISLPAWSPSTWGSEEGRCLKESITALCTQNRHLPAMNTVQSRCLAGANSYGSETSDIACHIGTSQHTSLLTAWAHLAGVLNYWKNVISLLRREPAPTSSLNFKQPHYSWGSQCIIFKSLSKHITPDKMWNVEQGADVLFVHCIETDSASTVTVSSREMHLAGPRVTKESMQRAGNNSVPGQVVLTGPGDLGVHSEERRGKERHLSNSGVLAAKTMFLRNALDTLLKRKNKISVLLRYTEWAFIVLVPCSLGSRVQEKFRPISEFDS